MRTLALLAALLLLALRGQAGPLAEPADQMTEAEDPLPTQAQDGAKDQLLAQAQAGDKDQAIAISFEGDERPARAIARPKSLCFCRPFRCLSGERRGGTCYIFTIPFPFCCT